MYANIKDYLSNKEIIRELNKNNRRICIISELRTGDIVAIYETSVLVPAEGASKQFQVKGKDITLLINKYSNHQVQVDFDFMTKYNSDILLIQDSQIWFSESQYGYMWCVA